MGDLFRRAVREAAPGVHGSPDLLELQTLGIAPDAVVDFSANLNPYGASPRVARALSEVAISRYPDRHCGALHRAIAAANGVSPENVLAGNGSSELIHLLAFAALEPDSRVLIAGPTFCEYARAAGLCGARVRVAAAGSPDFAPPLAALCRAAARERPRLVFLCNPNNPTGAYLPPEEVRALRESVRAIGGLLVLDEAYVDFVAGAWDCVAALGLEGMLVLRSLTKLHGLAGVRLGYALSERSVIERLRAAQPPWSVNSFAQAAGAAALADPAHLERSRRALLREREALRAGLEDAGYRPAPSATPFFLVPVGCASAFRRHCLAQGVLVRDCSSFGLPDYVRISARAPHDTPRLLAAARSFHER